MAISAQDVKQLKDMTSCGMMDCKRALEETGGDFDAAVKYLREKGLAKASKKSGRIAAEGLVYTKIDSAKNVGVVVEVNCETDFAAKGDGFVEFVEMVAQTVIDNDVKDVEALKQLTPCGSSEKIEEILINRIATIGENIQIRRFAKLDGNVYAYLHNGGGSIIGSLIKIESDANSDPAVGACAKDLLLQITANAPQYIGLDDIPPNVLDAEREIQLGIIKKENEAKPKPQNVIDKIVEGRMRVYSSEICLMPQAYVKNPDITVEKYIESIGKNIKVVEFVRFEKGEGLQKREDNFADEVASMMN